MTRSALLVEFWCWPPLLRRDRSLPSLSWIKIITTHFSKSFLPFYQELELAIFFRGSADFLRLVSSVEDRRRKRWRCFFTGFGLFRGGSELFFHRIFLLCFFLLLPLSLLLLFSFLPRLFWNTLVVMDDFIVRKIGTSRGKSSMGVAQLKIE